MKIKGVRKLVGEIKIPGDKSISHRGIILGAISKGETTIRNILLSEDTLKTIECFREMGIDISVDENSNIVKIKGKGIYGLSKPRKPLNCGNSGTTMRLLAGLLAGQEFPSTLVGDQSLSRRPMDRIIVPLTQMGASIMGEEGKYPPLTISPVKEIQDIKYELPVASAQVKSAILLASIYGQGNTEVIEKKVTRDHTERILSYFKENDFEGRDIYVPGDISSAAFFIVGGSVIKGSNITLKDVGINQTRTGIIDVIRQMGGNIKIKNLRVINNEPMADIQIKSASLKGIEIHEDIIGRLIDEIPIIAVAAAFAKGTTIIKGAEELKYKETDRIHAMVTELQELKADVSSLHNGLIVRGKDSLFPGKLKSYDDHRIAMALSIAALNIEGESEIVGSECVNISYPSFYDSIRKLM